MKDAGRKQRLLNRKRTVDLQHYDAPIFFAEKECVLIRSYESVYAYPSAIRNDGSLIAFAAQENLYFHISKTKSGFSSTPFCSGDNYALMGLIQVDDAHFLAFDCGGFIRLLFFGVPRTVGISQLHVLATSFVSISDNEFVVGDAHGVLRFFKHSRGRKIQLVRTVPGVHIDRITHIVVHADLMIAVSQCRAASVWNLTARSRVAMLPLTKFASRAAVNDHHIVTVSSTGVSVFYNKPGFRLRYILQGLNQSGITYCAYLVGDQLLLTAGMGHIITVTNLDTKLRIACFLTAMPLITNLALAPDGLIVATCAAIREERLNSMYQEIVHLDEKCVILQLSSHSGISHELKAESIRMFGIPVKRKRWLLRTVACITCAFVSIAFKRISKECF